MWHFGKWEQNAPTHEWNKNNRAFSFCCPYKMPLPPRTVLKPQILAGSLALLALHHKITTCLPTYCLKTIRKSDKHVFIPWIKETIKAFMTPPLMFSLLCDKSRPFSAKQIAGLPYFHQPKERKNTIVDSFAILCS